MQCEICGEDIREKPQKVQVEGTVLEVCQKCARYGKPADKWTPVSRKLMPTEKKLVTYKPKKDIFDKFTDEIVSDYARIIRESREKKGLTMEELALKIMEKAALLRKIERGEIVPEDNVRKKLEIALEIKLTEKVKSDEQRGGGYIKGTTLGDVAIIKRKKL